MNPKIAEPRHFEFCFPKLDTLLLVEVENEAVRVRATRATFSRDRKLYFIRELIAEGFIPEECHWLSLEEPESLGRGVRWTVDPSWLRISDDRVSPRGRYGLRALGLAGLLAVLLLGLAATGVLAEPIRGPSASSFWYR